MDFNSVLDWLKKNLFGVISNKFSSLTDWIGGLFGTAIGTAKSLGFDKDGSIGLDNMWDKAKNMLTGAVDNIKSQVNPDAGIANKAIPAKLDIDKLFKPLAAKLELGDGAAADLQKIVTDGTSSFLSDGIPALDRYGKPTSAISTALDVSAKIQDYLLGDGKSDIGVLAAKHPNLTTAQRKQIAEDTAAYLTGVPAGADLASLAGKTPTTGILGMLANLQTTVNATGYKKDSLTEADVTLKLNPAAMNAAISAIQPQVGSQNLAHTKQPVKVAAVG